MHTIFHAILRTISIQSPDHDTQALERAPVFCCARAFFDAVRAALRVAIEAGQTKGLILRHNPYCCEDMHPTCSNAKKRFAKHDTHGIKSTALSKQFYQICKCS